MHKYNLGEYYARINHMMCAAQSGARAAERWSGGGRRCGLAAGRTILEVDAAELSLPPYNRMTRQQSTVTPAALSQPQACFFDRSSSFIYSAGDEMRGRGDALHAIGGW
jgi:hypothetical protein